MLTVGKIETDYNEFKSIANELILKKKFDDAEKFIVAASRIAYNFNFIYADKELDSMLKQISCFYIDEVDFDKDVSIVEGGKTKSINKAALIKTAFYKDAFGKLERDALAGVIEGFPRDYFYETKRNLQTNQATKVLKKDRFTDFLINQYDYVPKNGQAAYADALDNVFKANYPSLVGKLGGIQPGTKSIKFQYAKAILDGLVKKFGEKSKEVASYRNKLTDFIKNKNFMQSIEPFTKMLKPATPFASAVSKRATPLGYALDFPLVLAAGKAAQVTGNAVRIGGVGSETVVYPTGQFNGTVNNLSSMVYDPDTDRFIFMTADTADQSQTSTSTHNPISKVLTIGADKSISQGTAQRMNANLNASQGVDGNGTAGCFSSGYYDTVVNKVYQFVYMAGYGAAEKGAYYTYGTVTGGTTNTISWEDMVRVSPDASTGPTSGDGGHHFAAGTVNGVRYGVWAHKNTSNQHANNGDGSALIGEMNTSSGSITWNDTAIIIDDSQNGRTLGMDVTFDTSAGKFLIQYTKGEETSSARDIHLVVATPSGTSSQSTLSLGTPVELINVGTFGGNGSQTFLQYDEELQRTVCFFMNGDTSRVNGCVISISGTTPTATTPSQIINEDCTEGGISATKNTELSTSSKGIYEVICKTSQNELYMINVEVTTSGVSHSDTLGARKFEIPNSSDADADHFAHHIAHGSSTSTDASCGILTTFGDGKATASDYVASWGNTGANQQSRPTAIFRQSDIAFSTNLTTENYIGIADANYSDGATATIQIAGSIDDAQSSLTIGQIYYVKPTGGLDRVQGLPKVVAGVATSASTLAIAGPPTDPQHDTRIYIGSRDFRREKDNSGNSNNATTFMIPANIPASEVVAYEIEIHNVSCNLTTDNIYVYCQPLASDGSTSVMSNTWHAVNSYVLGTSYSSTAYDFTSSTGLPCMLGGKNYGLFNNQQDSVPQIDNTTNDTSSGLYSKCIYTQSNRYASWNWDATYNGDGGTTGGLVSLDKGHASTDADASTTGYAHGFKIYAADSGGSAQSNISFTQGIVSVYAIVKSDLDRSGVSATGGNEDFGG